MATRIIDSPRERLLAIITNNFAICNGRWPMQFLLVAWALSRTLLRGEVSTFILELPPYRPPRFWQTFCTSLIDRTLVAGIDVLRDAVRAREPIGVFEIS